MLKLTTVATQVRLRGVQAHAEEAQAEEVRPVPTFLHERFQGRVLFEERYELESCRAPRERSHGDRKRPAEARKRERRRR
ncbi:hypothetical protein E2C01_073582 [Portunus trituberculatus]|uniref:Uncharacterized protein n=1 Tax=Portunus trituberculatus TaxID=210409 RepID=A0A5B7I3D7_PORTR|nr:hypothetical protein [Portunus trituberculatus]